MATIGVVLKSLGDIVALLSLKNILNGASFGVDFVAELIGYVALDGITFGINNVGKEREAAGGFFFVKVLSTVFFNFFRSGNDDSGFRFAWFPEALVRLSVVGDNSGEISFHRLVFFER